MLDEVIVRVLQGEASDIEQRQVREWLNGSLQHARRFRELTAVWSLVEGQRPTGALLDPPSAADIIGRAGWGTGVAGRRARTRRRVMVVAGVAAALLIAATLHVTHRAARQHEPSSPFVARELATNASEMVTVRLDDGSVVRLGPNSRLRFGGPSYGPREVSLEGRAYFAVAKQQDRPFHVRTPAGEARVLGTRFELRAGKEELRVVVIQGRVELDVGTARADVRAGQMSRIVGDAAPVVLPAEDAFSTIDRWVGKVIFFEATPLDEVARELSEHYGQRVMLADPSLASRTVTASFIDRSLEDVLSVICRVTDVRCVSDGSTATISRT